MNRTNLTDNSNESFIDLMASLLFVVILALLGMMLKNQLASQEVTLANKMMKTQISLRKQLGTDLAKHLGKLV